MGALTLKSFPFELRGWDIEKFESIDPTDSFGSNTRVYINKNQIVQIEPDYNSQTFNSWLTDKGRQFFDGIFEKSYTKSIQNQNNNFWINIFSKILKTFYLLNHCNLKTINKKNYTIIFENLGLESLSMLNLITQQSSLIKIRRAENYQQFNNNDLENYFQLNCLSDKIKLNSSTLCFIISTNPRYEGYYLNLNLRQRFLKGNFKCILLGSILNLTIPISYIGSNIKTLKSLIEGNNLLCQDIKFAINPQILFNNEIFKRNDSHNVLNMFKTWNFLNVFNQNSKTFNILTSSLYENGINSTTNFLPLTSNDINNSVALHFINSSVTNISNIKKIIEIQFLYNVPKKIDCYIQSINTNVNTNIQKNLNLIKLPVSNFFENSETFINTEGFIKRTTKLINQHYSKTNWQILRKILTSFKNLSNLKSQKKITFNCKKLFDFKNFIFFYYYASNNLNKISFYLSIKNKTVNFKKNKIFKNISVKINNTKVKYWIDDFFNGGKDEYSQNSLILSNCSKILRKESTNFI